MPFIETLAQQLGTQTAGGVMGLVLGEYQDRRQMRQQEKLQHLQIQGSKEMTDYNYAKQLQMWNDTNYQAQLAQMKKAGLNPALMYGMGGGGGQSTGSGSGATVQGANAPIGGNEIRDIMGLTMQSQLMAAQTENIKAQTEKTKGETANLPATGENIKASTANLTQGVANQKAIESLTKIQTGIAEIEKDIKNATKEEIIKMIANQATISANESDIIARNNWMDKATLNDKVDIIKLTLVNMGVQKTLMEAQKNNLITDAQLKTAQQSLTENLGKESIARRLISWRTLSIEERKATVQEIFGNVADDENIRREIMLPINAATGLIQQVPGTQVQPTRNPVGFKQY